VITRNFYPVPEARNSNMRHRPVGLGVQGLADAFMALRMPFDSPSARELNIQIFETIYHAALEASCELAQDFGKYESYEGSPISQGKLQFDLWGRVPTDLWDWTELRASIAQHGVRNSLLVAPMPTASTSQILGWNECFEPYTSMLYARRVLSGDFQVVCPWLLRDLINLGLWDDNMKNLIIGSGGSIQNIPSIPADLKAIYKTVWEISQKAVIDLSADRGAFIDQSQSLNIHLANPSFSQLTSMHFYGWKRGLKTGSYYLRTKPSANAIQFTIDASTLKQAKTNAAAAKIPTPASAPAADSLVAPMRKVSISTAVPSVPEEVVAASTPRRDDSPGPSEEEEISYEEAKRRAEERAEAALQCSIDNKDACVMCSG